MKNKKGFTLIELLVVIAIIGLLSTLAVVSLNNARSKARDARRTSDMKAMQSALELYIGDNETFSAVPASWVAVGTLLTNYLPAGAPVDPGTTNIYNLCLNVGTDEYLVAATLENNAVSPGVISISGWVTTDCRNQSAAQVLPTCNGATGFCLGTATATP